MQPYTTVVVTPVHVNSLLGQAEVAIPPSYPAPFLLVTDGRITNRSMYASGKNHSMPTAMGTVI